MNETAIGDLLELRIDSLAYRGAGVSRSGGMVVFVQETCPDEKVLARVSRVRSRFLEADLVSVLEPSSCRKDPPVCRIPVPGGRPWRVPGCVYDHLDYPEEVAAKQRQWEDFLARQARLEVADDILEAPFASPSDLHYRNKIVLHAGFHEGTFGLGYRGDDNRSVLDLPACPLAVDAINHALQEVRADERFLQGLRPDEDVTFRWTPEDGVVLWKVRPPRSLGVLHERSAVGLLEVPPDGFFQVNPPVADALVRWATDRIRFYDPPALIDLYCGVGVFSLAAANAGVPRVLGVDTGRAVVAAARRNASRLGLEAEFACLPASQGLEAAFRELRGTTSPLVLLDPPRGGLDEEVLRHLLRRRPAGILYVSCSPDTLARDLRTLTRDGAYRLETSKVFDLFPRTAHFETAVMLRAA